MQSILVVEDDAAVAAWIARLLRREGYVVRVTSSLAGATAELSKAAPDLTILDLILPDGLGISLLPRIGTHTRALLISGHTSAEVRGCLREPFSSCEFLPKPIDAHQLLEEICTLLSTQGTLPMRPYRDTMRAVVADELVAIMGDDVFGATVIARTFGDGPPIRSAGRLAGTCGYSRGGFYAAWRRTWPISPHEVVLFALVARAMDVQGSPSGRPFSWNHTAKALKVSPTRLRHGASLLFGHTLIGHRIRAEAVARGHAWCAVCAR